MKFELNTNNSKKLIIGLSIVFCTVILIIGVTTAFFTQSDSESTGNIVATDKVTLEYEDDDSFMLGELIPIDQDNVEYAYSRENNLKCKDDLGYNVCSIYQFTITNTGNVIQDLIIELHPKKNGFHNLEFNLYDITNNKNIISNKELENENKTPLELIKDLKLNTTNNKSNTYELVFYIENDKYSDQSRLDAGQSFGANIKVNSITTGEYLIEDLGDVEEDCWIFDETDNTKVNVFNGFDEDGNVKKHCETYFKESGGFYTVDVPSSYGGQPIKILGNSLFTGGSIKNDDTGAMTIELNKYSKIEKVTIAEGIEEIEDSTLIGAFAAIGTKKVSFDEDGFAIVEYYDRTITVELPSTLTKIGPGTFILSGVNNLVFHKNDNNVSNLKTIGIGAFSNSNLSEVVIPASVEIIETSAFEQSYNLTSLTIEGASDGTSKLKTIGDLAFNMCNIATNSSKPLIIPYSVNYIGEYAFYNNFNLTKLEFAGSHTLVVDDSNDVNYNLLTIGTNAFYGDGLDYSGDEEFILPARVKSIGSYAFQGNPGDPIQNTLKNIKYMGDFDLGTAWYFVGNVTVRDKDGNVMQS